MILLADWQWGAIAAAILALLTIGGFIKRLNENKQQISNNTEKELLNTANSAKISQLEKELEESKEEAELCLLQLHQAQEQLEQQISNNTEKELLNTANNAKISQLEKELEESKEEAELCLLQLHQVQEELEHYFLLSQDLQQRIDNSIDIVDQIPNNKLHEISDLRTKLASLIQRSNKKDMQIEILVNQQRNALLRASSAFKRVHHKQIPLINSKEEIAFL